MSFNIFMKNSHSIECEHCQGTGFIGPGAITKKKGSDEDLETTVTYNFTPKISEAMSNIIGCNLQHYRELLDGKSGKESLSILIKTRDSLAESSNIIDSEEERFVNRLVWWAIENPDAVWGWSH